MIVWDNSRSDELKALIKRIHEEYVEHVSRGKVKRISKFLAIHVINVDGVVHYAVANYRAYGTLQHEMIDGLEVNRWYVVELDGDKWVRVVWEGSKKEVQMINRLIQEK